MDQRYVEKHGVFIYFPEKKFDPNFRHYGAAALAEGLVELGYRVYSNVQDARFRFQEISSFKEGLMVFSVTEDVYSDNLMEAIEGFKPGVKVIHSMADISCTMLTPKGVPTFIAHENAFLTIPGVRIPWAFGLSRERLAACSNQVTFSERKRVVLRNFRPSGGQSVRECLDLSLMPHLEANFEIDRAISKDNHFERLSTYVGCLAYGGAFRADLRLNPYILDLPSNAAMKHWSSLVTFANETVVIRWDSWRWWESLASGCLTFHLDFEKYGFLLPVMPEPWVHYVPIDLSDPKGTVSRLTDSESKWAEIAAAGKQWALDHYSPRPTAARFIKTIASITA